MDLKPEGGTKAEIGKAEMGNKGARNGKMGGKKRLLTAAGLHA
jgi:hypothetical protein